MGGSLEGQVALVTGGGAGIGRGVALALAGEGADVVIAEIDPVRAEEAAARVAALGRRAHVARMDAMDAEQVRAAVQAAEATFGRLDILVNNAGGVSRRAFVDQSERSWRRLIDFNLVSMLAATHAAVPLMREGGTILNVSSIEAIRAAPGFAVYAACKAGMESFTRTMALELADAGIRINAIAPDHTDTPGTRGIGPGTADMIAGTPPPEAVARSTARRVPLGRPGLAEECGAAAVFLCSPAAAYITGVILPVDGGAAASLGWHRTGTGGWTLNP